MLQNFLVKAKSVIEDMDRTLTETANPKSPTKFEYDDSFFTFQLEGGPIHSEVLTASARIKYGKNTL